MLWFFCCAWLCFVVVLLLLLSGKLKANGSKAKKMKSKTGLHIVSHLFLNLKTFLGKTCMVCDEVSPFFPSQVDCFHCSPKDDVLRKPWHVVFPQKNEHLGNFTWFHGVKRSLLKSMRFFTPELGSQGNYNTPVVRTPQPIPLFGTMNSESWL